ncbi:unnamed protein product [Cuscuta campestris]|uniref:Uncharacterized protein n=1 Tax=Cuscuta campestris TaxID=132261 RepID=A0A484M9V5_9ASTE|nr:unnamed protein product [Cuscuta campestris]
MVRFSHRWEDRYWKGRKKVKAAFPAMEKPVDATTSAHSTSAAQVVTVARPLDDGFILLDDRLLLELQAVMQKTQVHELRNLVSEDIRDHAREATLRAGDNSTRGPYNVGKLSVYPGPMTDPEPSIVRGDVIPDAIPLRRVQDSTAQASTAAGSLRRWKKKEKVVKFNSKFVIPNIDDVEGTTTVQPLPTSQQPPRMSNRLSPSRGPMHTSEAGQGGQQLEATGQEEAAEEALQRKRRRMKSVDQSALSSNAGKGQSEPQAMVPLARSDEELFEAFCAALNYPAWLEGMMVACRMEAQVAWLKAEKAEEKLMEQYASFQSLYAKHYGLLKESKETDAQAQEKISDLEEKAAQSTDEIAQLRAELEKERADRDSHVAAWAIPDRETVASRGSISTMCPKAS